jgi:hypothetical protein
LSSALRLLRLTVINTDLRHLAKLDDEAEMAAEHVGGLLRADHVSPPVEY